MSQQEIRERECIHRQRGASGAFYQGKTYVQSLQRLRISEAMKISSNVSAFFWADAAHMLIWLCRECAADLSLQEA